MKYVTTLQPPKAISFENTDTDNPPWTEDTLGPPLIRLGRNSQQLPAKIATTINLDVDILVWLKSKEEGYETLINNVLRHAMQEAR